MTESQADIAVVPPPSDQEEGQPEDPNEFDTRVNRLLGMIAEDPSLRDRMLTEMYVTLSEFQAQFAEMQDNMEKIGPRALFKSMFGKGD